MKLPFLSRNNSSSPSHSSSCSSSSSSWPWPSCHQNPKTLSFRNTVTSKNPNPIIETMDTSFSSEENESIENVIKGLKSSKRFIFEKKGRSNSILEEANQPRNGFVLLSLESKDPYYDFKRSMEEMVDAHKLHRNWRSLEKLLYWFLKVNSERSHGYIFAAFVDLLVGLAFKGQNDSVSSSSTDNVAVTTVTTETCSTLCSCSNQEGNTNPSGESPSSHLSFYTSCSSDSDEVSSPLVPRVTHESRVCCLSSFSETEEKIKDTDVDGYVSC
ncbi:PREDICTED: transcription repressor OFP15-like [Tarenaya hassleriana]|uniref:transcription repressor OFP15-like n=1 Tax=Tarenaya hassleriana TaxID=28532 RepID=UPI00053CA410|nr:PREDICTED: transcription repressor OFP15-like [Tarenaya hassleriana]